MPTANILSLGVGASISWTSPYLSVLKGDKSPLDQAITSDDASWIGSLLAIGALTGSFFYGWMSEKIGRFQSLRLAAVPQLFWWLIVISSPSAKWLFLGRFLAGFSAGGSFTLIPLYIAEISQDKIRGSLGSFFILSTNFGMLLMYVVGEFFDYYTTPKIMLLLPASFLLLFSFFPETPIFLLRKNKLREAEKSLKFLRGCKHENSINEDVKCELEKMIRKVELDAITTRDSIINDLRNIMRREITTIFLTI